MAINSVKKNNILAAKADKIAGDLKQQMTDPDDWWPVKPGGWWPGNWVGQALT